RARSSGFESSASSSLPPEPPSDTAFAEISTLSLHDALPISAGELKIGVGDTISRHFLLPYLERFYNRYPGVKMKIENGTTSELIDRKSTRLNSSHVSISYAVFCLTKKKECAISHWRAPDHAH